MAVPITPSGSIDLGQAGVDSHLPCRVDPRRAIGALQEAVGLLVAGDLTLRGIGLAYTNHLATLGA